MNVAEEEIVLWVASDLCSPSAVVNTNADGSVSASTIPVTLYRNDENVAEESVNTIQFDQKDVQQYCVMEEVEMSRKRARKRGAVWNYFVPSIEDRAQCTYCNAIISYKGKSTNNLLRHLRTKHSKLKVKPETTETKVESCLADDGSTYYVLSTAENPSSPTESHSSFQAEADSEQANRRRGGVWAYFETDAKKRAKCKLCSNIISFKGGSTTNLLRHMKSKHTNARIKNKVGKEISVSSLQHSFAEIVNECVKSDDENEFQTITTLHFSDTPNDISNGITADNKSGLENITILSSMEPNFSEDIDIQELTAESATVECTEPRSERKKSALAWNFFSSESEERAKCNFCSAVISFKGGSTGNLLRHLKTKHSELHLTAIAPKEHSDLLEEKPGIDTIENEELAKFVQLLNPKYKLEGVQLPCITEKEGQKRLLKRGTAKHYFDIRSDEKAICQLCNTKVNLKNGSKAPMLRHLKAKHMDVLEPDMINNSIENIENVPIMSITSEFVGPAEKVPRKMRKRGLVWNHFAPLEDERAKCNVCPAVISYKRGSTSNLLRHMKKKHKDIDVSDEDALKTKAVYLNPIEDEEIDDDDNDDEDDSDDAGKPVRFLRKRGRVWHYFRPIARDKAKCSLCNVVVDYLKGSTTNLLRHMKKKHIQIDLSKERPFTRLLKYPREKPSVTDLKETIVATITNSTTTTVSEESSSTSSTEKISAIHRRSEAIFRKYFDKFLNRPVSVTQSKMFDEQLVKMIVKQYCPFTIVESEEFRSFIQTVNPGYSLPSRKTISYRLIPELYEKCVEEVREKLRNIKCATIALNSWTVSNNECYMSITAYYIDENCKLYSNLLDCFNYNETDDSQHLASSIKKILMDWGILQKLNAVVCGNATNVLNAVHLQSWNQVPCFANMINEVVQKGFLAIQELLEKVRMVSEYYKTNPEASKKLTTMMKEMNLFEGKMKSDDTKNWVTTYELFMKFIECKDAIEINLESFGDNLPMPNDFEWTLMDRMCKFLKPLLDITNEVCEKNVTVSKVIPLSRCITNYLRKTLQDSFLLKEIELTVKEMLDAMVKRFQSVEDNLMLAESTLLDPRFKNQGFFNIDSYNKTYQNVLEKASIIQVPEYKGNFNNHAVVREVIVGEKESPESDTIWEEFDSKVVHLHEPLNPAMAAAQELDNYITQEALIGRNADPLTWWNERKSVFPRLYELMKQRLSITATAVSKDFTNGQLVYEKRNKLSANKVSMVVFLNHNL